MRGNDFADMNAFVAVADHSSFTKAATALAVSVTTVSQSIRALEGRLGVRLLNRTTRSVALTEAGERLLERIRPLLTGFDEALESVNDFRDKPAGRLRITVAPPVSRKVLAPALAGFLDRYPEIALEVSVDKAITDIVAARFDAGIRVGNRVDRDMVAIRIMDGMQFVAVASPEYIARHGPLVTLDDLMAHNCIRLRFADGALQPWRFTADGKIVEMDVNGSVVVNDSDLASRAALDGVGVHYGLADCVAPLIAEGRLVALLEEHAPPPSEPFFLYYPSRKQNPGSLQAFIDYLRTTLRPRPVSRDGDDGRAMDGRAGSNSTVVEVVSAAAPRRAASGLRN
jgi:DNA-binding transcriptional LysR family regulator